MMTQNNQLYRPTQAIINLAAIKKNLALAADKSGDGVMAIVKANAYGFGIREVVTAIYQIKECLSFGVAFTEEALELRELLNQLDSKKRILTLEGFFSSNDLEIHLQHKIDATIHHPEQMEILKQTKIKSSNDSANSLGVWLKCNSGMNRLGLSRQQAIDASAWVSEQPHIKLLGIMTHFSSANRGEPTVSMKQMAHFRDTLEPIWAHLKATTKADELPKISICNSPGIIAGFAQNPFAHVTTNNDLDPQPQLISRPGLILYGGSPMDEQNAQELGITAGMTLKSRLMSVRQLTKGESVGYEDRTWTASSSCLMGVVPIGYADGYPFIRPDKITQLPILVNGRKCFLGGRVSMDMLCVDLSNCPDAKVGDEVELWGDKLPVNEVAATAGGPPQRLLSALTKRVPRIYLNS